MATNWTPICITGFISFILGMILISSLVSYEKTNDLIETECSVNQVNYTKSINDINNMVKCDCGKRCTSDEGTCLKLFLSTNEIKHQMVGDDVQDKLDTCTFQEKNCKISRGEALMNVKEKADEYSELINTNNTIPCYVYKNQIYLSNSFNFDLVIVLSTMFGACMLCCICASVAICCENRIDRYYNGGSGSSHTV